MTEGPYKLPQGWRWVRLGDLLTECIGGSWGTGDDPDGVGVLRPNNIGQDGTIVWQDIRWRKVPSTQLRKRRLQTGDIILTKSNSLEQVGRAAFFEHPNDGRTYVPSNFLQLLRPDRSRILPKYLHYALKTSYYTVFVRRIAIGSSASLKNLSARVLKEFPIPLPPLSEQRRIVDRIEELLERVREARRLREEAKKEAERLWQSVLAETFPGPGEDPPPGWKWVKLGEICEHKSGIWGPEAKAPTDGFPIVRSTEIAGHRIDPQSASIRSVPTDKAQRYALQTGDILINKSSGSSHLVGWPAIFKDPGDGRTYLFSNFMLRLRVDKSRVDPWFLLYYLHNPMARANYLGAQDTTSGLRNLRVRDFISQPIPLPPLPEQRRIVAYLEVVQEKIRDLKAAQEKTETEISRLEQSILDKAFRREL